MGENAFALGGGTGVQAEGQKCVLANKADVKCRGTNVAATPFVWAETRTARDVSGTAQATGAARYNRLAA